jgi:hypothetical protein
MAAMGLIRKLFWFALFLIATFCFVVLFEHGFHNFPANAQVEFENLKKLYHAKIERAPDESDAVAR